MSGVRFGLHSSSLIRSTLSLSSVPCGPNVNRSVIAIARQTSVTPPAAAKRWYSNSTSSSPQAYLESLSDIESFAAEEEQIVKGISILTLDRPAAKNAISQKMIKELEECIEKIRFDRSIRVLILRSKVENTFCAGADLKERKQMTQIEVDQFLAALRKTFSSLENLPLPTLTALDGLAMGGGMELALCTDLRFATTSTKNLGLPETRLGIIPGAGGTYRMTKLIGPARTKELVFSARMLNGQQAYDLGIVDQLAANGQSAFQACIQSAKAMAQNGPLALRAAKAAISKGQSLDTETALDWERACYEKCLASKDRLEGLRAFAEKRKPVYTGE